MLSSDLNAHYRAVISDLESRKAKHGLIIEHHKREIEEIDQTLSGIKILIAKMNGLPSAEEHKFVNMSMRWGILHILGDNLDGMASAEIAAFLRSGGMRSNGQNFNGNVSAVLSDMKSKKEEVSLQLDTGKWKITGVGHDVLTSIKARLKIGEVSS